ncbi:MAG: histidine phosphatase family protein [Bryobacteraceae bacterium]
MSDVYLIRHGQAGTRHHYDTLSELGRHQARLLGDYFASRNLQFQAAFSGGMARQNQTGEQVIAAYQATGLKFPEIHTHDAWREFDLDDIYRALAPQLCAADPAFKIEYEAMREQARASVTAEIHRRWAPCDIQVVEAWLHAKFPYNGESWTAFQQRVAAAPLPEDDINIAVFTSATPTAIWAGRSLDIHDTRALRIAQVLHNTSITVLRVRGEQVRLLSMNEVPHLTRAEWRTHR